MCTAPACQLPLDVITRGVGPHVNKFKQASNDDHQMSVVGVAYSRSHVWGGEGRSTYMTYPMMHMMLPTHAPTTPLTEWQTPVKNYLPTTSLAIGRNSLSLSLNVSQP